MPAVLLDGVVPHIAPQAVEGLKFSVALPADLARATLAERFVDEEHAAGLAAATIVMRADAVQEERVARDGYKTHIVERPVRALYP